jgi:hypothetical protein
MTTRTILTGTHTLIQDWYVLPGFKSMKLIFSIVVRPTLDRELDSELPLVQDMSKAWFPVQVVEINGPQLLRGFGHLNEAILDKARHFLRQDGSNVLFKTAAEIVAGFQGLPQATLENDGPAAFSQNPALIPVDVTDAVSPLDTAQPRGNKRGQAVTRDSKISLLYVRSQTESPVDADLRQKVKHGLRSLSSSVSDKVWREKEKSATDFTRRPNPDSLRTNFDEFKIEADLVFAIIDDSFQSKVVTRKVIANLHHYADCTSGFLLVCATRSYLTRLFNRPLNPSVRYLPRSLRAKINYKLGGINFESGLPSVSKGSRLMIAGQHTAHQHGARFYCPSVSAIVATNEVAGTKYLESVRPHVTTLIREDSDGSRSREIPGGCYRLQEMMIERFKACKSAQGPPTHLLYFCDSQFFDNTDKARLIGVSIDNAYNKMIPIEVGKLPITLVVVNKNTEITYEFTKQADTDRAVPEFDFVAAGAAKYRYYVMRNDIGFTQDELVTMVSDINTFECSLR